MPNNVTVLFHILTTNEVEMLHLHSRANLERHTHVETDVPDVVIDKRLAMVTAAVNIAE